MRGGGGVGGMDNIFLEEDIEEKGNILDGLCWQISTCPCSKLEIPTQLIRCNFCNTEKDRGKTYGNSSSSYFILSFGF